MIGGAEKERMKERFASPAPAWRSIRGAVVLFAALLLLPVVFYATAWTPASASGLWLPGRAEFVSGLLQLEEAAETHDGPIRWVFLRDGEKTYPRAPETRAILDSLTREAAPGRTSSIEIIHLHTAQPVRGFDPPARSRLEDDSIVLFLPGDRKQTPFRDGSGILEDARASAAASRNLAIARNVEPGEKEGAGGQRRVFAVPVDCAAAEIAIVECSLTVSDGSKRARDLHAELRWASDGNGVSGSIRVPIPTEPGMSCIEFATGDCPAFAIAGGAFPSLELVLPDNCEIVGNSLLILSPGLAGMVRIPAGTLKSGDRPSDRDRFCGETEPGTRRIEPFWIDRFEYPGRRWAIPVVNVDWYEAASLCAEMGKRLCTEWEWERACRGPANSTYPYGDAYSRTACFTDRRFNNYSPRPAGSFPACVSYYGVYDLCGNVNEWTSSTLSRDEVRAMGGRASYGIYDSEGDPPGAIYPILRGGDWGEGSNDTRCANRDHFHLPDSRLEDDGFRCCRDDAAEAGIGK